MMTQPLIRKAETRDLEALGRLGGELVRLHHGFDSRRFLTPEADVEEGYAWFLGTQLRREDTLVLVAELDGEVVGYVYAGIEPHSWKELREAAGFVHDLVVDARFRGQGIASRLLEEAARALEELGAPRIMLWTAEANAGARRLFERLGFRATMVEMTRERR